MITAIKRLGGWGGPFEDWALGLLMSAETDIFSGCYLPQQGRTASPVFFCGLRWNVVSIKHRDSRRRVWIIERRCDSAGVLISTVQLIWCSCFSCFEIQPAMHHPFPPPPPLQIPRTEGERRSTPVGGRLNERSADANVLRQPEVLFNKPQDEMGVREIMWSKLSLVDSSPHTWSCGW